MYCAGINQISGVVVVTTGNRMVPTLPVVVMTQTSNIGEVETGKAADIMAVIMAEETSSRRRTTIVVFTMPVFVNSQVVMHRHRNIVDR